MVKIKNLISFAKLNKYYFLPFLAPVFLFIGGKMNQQILLANINLNPKDIIIDYSNPNNIFYFIVLYILFIGLGGILFGLLYFVSVINTKTLVTKNEAFVYEISPSTLNPKLSFYKNYKREFLDKTIIFVGIFLFSFSFIFVNLYSISKLFNSYDLWIYQLPIITLFSVLILKIKVYKHQKLSIIIALIGILISCIPKINIYSKEDIYPNIIMIIFDLIFIFSCVLIKNNFDKYYVSPYLCSIYIGLTEICLIFFGLIIYSFILKGNFSLLINLFTFMTRLKKIGYFILFMVFSGSYYGLSYLVFYYFSLTMSTLIDIINNIISFYYKWFTNKQPEYWAADFIGYLIAFIGILVFNEIIVFGFWGLNKYTKVNIEKRSETENNLFADDDINNRSGSDNNNSFDDTDYKIVNNSHVNKEKDKKIPFQIIIQEDSEDLFYLE